MCRLPRQRKPSHNPSAAAGNCSTPTTLATSPWPISSLNGNDRPPTRRSAMRKLLLYATLCGAALLPLASAHAEDDATARAQRWQVLSHAIFGNRPVQDGHDMLSLQAPYRAEDAALVPVAITLKQPAEVKGLYLVIDNNPSPLAAHFSFGPDADPHEIDLRVRVNDYTDMHAVAELQDGTLGSVADFVKAAGGSSAPSGQSDAEALQGLGEMKLRLLGD